MSGLETYPTLEDLAAEALSTARIAAIAIREDVLHRLAPQERTGPELLVRMFGAREIFAPQVLDHLNALETPLVERITECTFVVDRAEAGEGNVSPVFWQEARTTEEVDGLSKALAVILELKFLLEAIQDRLAAEAAIEALRQAL
ncbi:hypothetical protein [Alloyangia pacifica]|uniref:Uncharacterized protein n=1 Tax=Alloyangia pacifica TaxID=311180 RepID=A0A1I6RJK5_9RHOB|nr:hypothetical protein [Alloyangia pacifica]SDG52456.1 hypothetical protein SAMN04488245_103141 [Alloyangia pacifica]SFS64943.1 hypothetical protein SAMN04488050_103141 [Alloyangia pacifica]